MKEKTISYDEIREKLNVSYATINNWVKSGYLVKKNKKSIDYDSYINFINNIVGKEKLNKRSNKLHIDDTSIDMIHLKYRNLLKSDKINFDVLPDVYQQDLSLSYRNKYGIYYTPQKICDFIFERIKLYLQNLKNIKMLEPSCGCGNFIVSAIKNGVSPNNIVGYDIDEISIEILKKRLNQLPIQLNCSDFLIEFGDLVNNYKDFFDLIVTNPPFTNKANNYNLEGEKIKDTFVLFLLYSLKLLKNDGILAFVLPKSFFNSIKFENVRSEILKYQILEIIDLGCSFDGVYTDTQIIILKKREIDENLIKVIDYNKNVEYTRLQSDFIKNPFKIINFWIQQEKHNEIMNAFNENHIKLKDYAVFGLGIITGNNNKYLSKQKLNQHYYPIWSGKHITKNKLLDNEYYFDIRLFDKFQQVAPIEYYQSKKIIYKFICNRLCFYYDEQGVFVLNSANFFILNDKFPLDVNVLVDYLNSDFFNDMYWGLFGSHKVLSGFLGILPIPLIKKN